MIQYRLFPTACQLFSLNLEWGTNFNLEAEENIYNLELSVTDNTETVSDITTLNVQKSEKEL